MFQIDEHDFQDRENFSFLWRWKDEDGWVFPEEVLAQIRVFQPDKARQLEVDLLPMCQLLSRYLFEPIPQDTTQHRPFGWIHRLKVENQLNEQVTQWLSSQEISGETIMLLSWEKTVAVAVPWGLFCRYWHDFCYPGSDDICIRSLCGKWYALYYHENIFLVAQQISV